MLGRTIVQPLALTLGEPAGIGPDLALAIWHRRAALNIPPIYLVRDATLMRHDAAQLGLAVPIAAVGPDAAGKAFASALPVVAITTRVAAEPGRPDASSA